MNAQTKIQALFKEIENLKKEQANCKHDWTPPRANHIYHEAYTIPGDPPGTMGIDWRGPCYVAAETIKRWTRECRKCGLEQHTNKIETKQVEGNPIF